MLMPSIFRENFMDNFFDDFARPVVRSKVPETGLMKTDVVEKEDCFELSIDLPGVKKENVKAELADGYMTITAEAKEETEEKEGRYIRRERFYGTSRRSFYVGDLVTEKDIKAKFEDGVLHVTVPKKEPEPEIPEQKYISIE